MSEFDSMFEASAAPALDQVFGDDVTLKRGELESEPFNATWQTVEYEVSDLDGFLTKIQMRDYYFKVTDAVISGRQVDVRSGDNLIDVTTGFVFQILPAGTMPAAELTGDGARWKVHTKRV